MYLKHLNFLEQRKSRWMMVPEAFSKARNSTSKLKDLTANSYLPYDPNCLS